MSADLVALLFDRETLREALRAGHRVLMVDDGYEILDLFSDQVVMKFHAWDSVRDWVGSLHGAP